MDLQVYLLSCLFSTLIGIGGLLLGYKVFDWITPKWDFRDAFTGDSLSNAGIVIAAFFIGLSIIIGFTAS